MNFARRDGNDLEIRPIRADDKELLASGFRLVSEESRQRRFLTAKPRLSASELRYLTEVDGWNHVALVAVEADHPTHIAAVARFVRDPERPDTAEFAILVGDAYQRQGLGRSLGAALVEEARARGLRRFTATTGADNVAAQRLISSISEHLAYVPTGTGAAEVVAELAA